MITSPPVLEFLDLLIERAAPRRLVVMGGREDIIVKGLHAGIAVTQLTREGAARPAALDELDDAARTRFSIVHFDLEAPAPLDPSLLRDSIVVALDVLDGLADPRGLLAVLAAARSTCQFMLFNATDRVRRRGYGTPDAKDASAPSWTAETFFDELRSLGFPRSMLFGFVSSDAGAAPKDSVLVISGADAEFRQASGKVRIAAVLNVFNEVDIIDEVVRYLDGQAIEVHVIDNWSDDGTYELCHSLQQGGLIKELSRFPAEPTGEYEWAKQLEHAGRYAAALDADWIIHYDADEIRCSPWHGVDLHDGICFVDAAGYTAIDFTVVDFRFTEPGGGAFESNSLRYFEFARHPSFFVQIKAWKNLAPVDLAKFGGHEVVFPQRRVYPIKFLTRHYSLRSSAQAARKIFRDRIPRIGKERTERGWHVHFDQYKHLDGIEQWRPGEVTLFDPTTFDHEFLLERVSGAGVPRDEQVYLNRNTARILNQKFELVAQSVSQLDEQARQAAADLASRDRLIAHLSEQLHALPSPHLTVAELRQKAAERESMVLRLNGVLAERDTELRTLRASLDASRIELSASRIALQKRDSQLESKDHLLRVLRAERDRLLQMETDSRQALFALHERHETAVSGFSAERADRTRQVASLRDTVRAGNLSLSIARAETEERDVALSMARAEIEGRQRKVSEQEILIETLHREIEEHARQIHMLSHESEAHATEAGFMRQDAANARAELAKVLRSKSWWVTRPLRVLRRYAGTRAFTRLRKFASDASRWSWNRLPVSLDAKRRFKENWFTRAPFLFSWSLAYRNWAIQSGRPPPPGGAVDLDMYPNGEPGPADYVALLDAPPLAQKPVKLVCFYLPQFHPIPENNEWWGEGFTEWTNVRPAQPQFAGHYQPHIPGELGYYDLLDTDVQRRQVELAKLYGVEAFCFYFYWFGGTRLLDKPLRNYLGDKALDLPFCLCWANEDWSRRWDGQSQDVLIAQKHSSEDDLAFIEHVAQYMRDPRYLRIDGKPLLLVYRPNLLPSAKVTATRWRRWCRHNGLGEIYLAYTQSFENVAPAHYGFDAAVEFPPNNSAPPNITDKVQPVTGEFACTVSDWRIFVQRSKQYKQPGYTLFRGVCPSWDNTPRLKNRARIFHNSSPAMYRRWLENAIADTRQRFTNPDERLVFVNAWNEWAEGAHLEPDQRYGYAYLHATRLALEGAQPVAHRRIVLVAHDAHPHGAQLLCLHMARTLSSQFGFQVDLVCLGDGVLKTEFARWASVHDLAGIAPDGAQARELASRLYEAGNRAAIINTTVSGALVDVLADSGIECIALIHEMKGVLDAFGLHSRARSIASRAERVVFPAAAVASSFASIAPLEPSKVVIKPQGLYKRLPAGFDREHARRQLRSKLGVPPDCLIVLGAGYADQRKGIDLFVEAAHHLQHRLPQARWVWIGHWEGQMQRRLEQRLSECPQLKGRLICPGLQAETELFFGGADVFALTSREDPFPSVLMEAMNAALPVVAFEDAGGFIELFESNPGFGQLVAQEDAQAFAEAVGALLDDGARRAAWGRRAAGIAAEQFSFREYLFELLALTHERLPRISVVVPNFNYAQYLRQRLDSICSQRFPIYEIIFLDDCSTDDSLQVARGYLESQAIDYRIVVNDQNSKSVFALWKKGVDLARGDYVWIAEADDGSDPEFLGEVMKGLRDPQVVLSYCESRQVDSSGAVIAGNYLEYVADIGAPRWTRGFVREGRDEVAQALGIMNTLPNVSAVLFRRDRLHSVLQEHLDQVRTFRIAGDWVVYLLLLQDGKIAFSPRALNEHRRHASAMTMNNFGADLIAEIQRGQALALERFELPPEQQLAGERYIESLKQQFGVVDSGRSAPVLSAAQSVSAAVPAASPAASLPIELPVESAPLPMGLPVDFDEEFYLFMNPDLRDAPQLCPAHHYVRHGRDEGRVYGIDLVGAESFREGRQTVLVVSHEASRTGAPAVSLNIVQSLVHRYNVVTLLLGAGPLADAFRMEGAAVAKQLTLRERPDAADFVVAHLARRFDFRFAIVNSIESRVVLRSLGRNFIPSVALIHEFASCYPRIVKVFDDTCLWAGELVFSSTATLEDALTEYPYLRNVPTHVLPQGRCVMPSAEFTVRQVDAERARLRRVMRPEGNSDAIVVLGAGFIHYRKGVDIFIDCAARVVCQAQGQNFRFVWIGKGFDPELDGAYSVYLADQIRRAGLENHMEFVSETFAIDSAYRMADLFLLTSRLDPLPNVAIDAMAENIPIICFDRTTGIAGFLIDAGLRPECVAAYLDTSDMVDKVLAMAASSERRQDIARRSREASIKYFDMANYVRKLESLALAASAGARQEREDTQIVAASTHFRPEFARKPAATDESHEQSARAYVRAWATSTVRRKPFPGFHPGMYAEQHGLSKKGVDPFVDFLRCGEPAGPWSYPVLSPRPVSAAELPSSERVALHVHAYFPEMLPDMVRRLLLNRIAPDLFVSVADEEAGEQLADLLRGYPGRIRDIRVVPNRGRDIGPFLAFLGEIMPAEYEFVGHIHTKKSFEEKTTSIGRMWYRFLMNNLIGGTSGGTMADRILHAMQSDESLGMLFPDDPWIVGWDNNRALAEPLAATMGISDMTDNFNFPVGTMFWARVAALEPLRRLKVAWEDYPPEPLAYDGTFLHALERLMPWAVRAAGFSIATTHVEGLTR